MPESIESNSHRVAKYATLCLCHSTIRGLVRHGDWFGDKGELFEMSVEPDGVKRKPVLVVLVMDGTIR